MVLFGFGACGGGNLDPGAGNAAGTGTATLALDGSVRASPRPGLVNPGNTTDFETTFSVRVSLNNQTVTTGTVTVTSSTGKVSLTYQNGNRWSGGAAGYDQVYVLDVVSGPDKAEGVRVDGPDIQVFSQPVQNTTVDSSLPLMITWDRDMRADAAELRTANLNAIEIPDTGSYVLSAGSLRADRSQPRQNALQLTRTNRVVPAGAVAGSSWTVALENEIDVVAQPLLPL